MNEIHVCGQSDAGRVRLENQDCFLINGIIERSFAGAKIQDSGMFLEQYGLLCAVADGMGGHSGGAIASHMLLRHLALNALETGNYDDPVQAGEHIRQAVDKAHEIIVGQGKVNPSLADMGTTLAGVYIKKDYSVVFHAGDSRVYRFRGGYLNQLTSDHTAENLLWMTTGKLPQGPKSGVITNSIGGGQGVKCYVEVNNITFIKGDILLICSDGLTDMVETKTIEEILSRGSGIDEKSRQLIGAANEAGGMDNITVILIEYRGEKNA
ncbi:MAG: protein phosphatase 2C domain-containing protein [Bacillota bacterium]|nr:protein phosphatase 2C domain-containing protein [Bacillota bacterium]